MATETAVDVVMPQMGVSVSEGTITKWLKQQGEQVEVGTKVGQIGGDGAAPASAPPSGSEPQAREEAPPEPATQEAAAEAEAPSTAETPAPSVPQPTGDGAKTNGKTFVSPVVARIASEHGVDPNQVEGTGRGGRVTKKDILQFIESGGPAAPAEAPAPPATEAPQPEPAP